ncbi:hypothetical protein ACHAWF_003405 [Thalassiosira exigua]
MERRSPPGDWIGWPTSGDSSADPSAFPRQATGKSVDCAPIPVYGSGTIFYLDRSGTIEGVLL